MVGIVLLQSIFGRVLRRLGGLAGNFFSGMSDTASLPVEPAQTPPAIPQEPVSSWLPQVLNPIYLALIVAVAAIVTTFALRFYVAKKALSGKISFSYEPVESKRQDKKAEPEKKKREEEGNSIRERLKNLSKKGKKQEEKKAPAKKKPTARRTPKAKESESEDMAVEKDQSPSIEAITREELEERLPDIKEYAKEIAKEEMRKGLAGEEEEVSEEEGIESEEEEKKPWE